MHPILKICGYCWLCFPIVAGAGLKDEDVMVIPYTGEEYQWREEEPPALPPLPVPEQLKPAYISATASNQMFIDPTTLSVGSDQVVRYVLLIKTRGGASNLSFEGLRCANNSYRIYATATQGQWITHTVRWRPVEFNTLHPYHSSLAQHYFCQNPTDPPQQRRTAILRRLAEP